MKLIGLVGGVSWLSTIEYYRLINEGVSRKLGGLSSAQCVIYSLNFAEVAPVVTAQNWERFFEIIGAAAEKCRNAGAEAIVLCANTPHLLAERLEQNFDLPVIHIADATARELNRAGVTKALLLGTRATMEMDFFRSRLGRHQVDAVIPSEADRDFINASIFGELGRGEFRPETRARYVEIIESFAADGGEGVILGCTEIPLLVKQKDCSIPVFDTTAIHAAAAVEFALG